MSIFVKNGLFEKSIINFNLKVRSISVFMGQKLDKQVKLKNFFSYKHFN
jgi:hypothetical protein